jgi:hypothetical protein
MTQGMNYNFGNNSMSFLLISLIVVMLPTLTTAQTEQKQLTNAEKLHNLKLDSTNVGELVYYSKGYSERAKVIGKQIENAKLFYLDSLNIDVQIKIALLDTTDYNSMTLTLPYGLPFVNNGLIFQPADLSIGAVRDMYAPFAGTASDKIISNLNNAGFEYKDALNFMVDLIALHEIGHTQVYSYELDAKQAWFNEFMASYFGYAYMQIREPKMAVVWDNIMQAGFESYVPKHRSLNEFNELYVGVGVGDYVWFQNAFQERIKEVYSKRGLDFIRLAKEKLSDSSFQPETADELLEFLEEIEPGFIKWAEPLEQK